MTDQQPVGLRTGLERLLQPLEKPVFMRSYDAGETVVVHGSPERLPELFGLPSFSSAEAVLKVCTGASITAMLPDRKDESNSIQVTADVALKLYRTGMNLSIGSAERFLPGLAPWVDNLRIDLGLPSTTFARCIVYLSPAGAGAPPHFDPNINFSLQIKGHKTWQLAGNRSVDHPTERHVMNDEPAPALMAQAHSPLPTEMPADTQTVALLPGSLLFVPRGHWHATSTEDETLSLNLTFSQPSWAMTVASLLMKKLHRRAEWRATPSTRADAPGSRKRELGFLLDSLRASVAELSAESLLRESSCHPQRFRRAVGVSLRREGGELAFDFAGRGHMPLDFTDEYLPALEFMLAEADWFGVEDVLSVSRDRIPPADLIVLVERLVSAGVLECSDD